MLNGIPMVTMKKSGYRNVEGIKKFHYKNNQLNTKEDSNIRNEGQKS